jgi:copper(I)-binding protein
MRKILPISVLSVGVFLLLAGCSTKELLVQDAWSRPGQAGGTSAIYFTIDNPLETADTLLGVTSDAAETVEMHMTQMENDVMTMIPQRTVPITALSTIKFEPGGLHVMLINLKNDLKAGESFSATLSFDKAGPVTVNITVKEP